MIKFSQKTALAWSVVTTPCRWRAVEAGKVAVRTRRGKDLGSLDVSEVIEKLQQEIRSRSLH
jgi:threonyl-tRNA synthetase